MKHFLLVRSWGSDMAIKVSYLIALVIKETPQEGIPYVLALLTVTLRLD